MHVGKVVIFIPVAKLNMDEGAMISCGLPIRIPGNEDS